MPPQKLVILLLIWNWLVKNVYLYSWDSCVIALPAVNAHWSHLDSVDVTICTDYIGKSKCTYLYDIRISTGVTGVSNVTRNVPLSVSFKNKLNFSVYGINSQLMWTKANYKRGNVQTEFQSMKQWLFYRNASHHSFRQPKQSPCCLVLAPQVSFSQSRKSSSSFFSTRNCPSTT